MNEHNYQLNKRFSNALATIKRSDDYDDRYSYELTVHVQVPSDQWNLYKRRKMDPINRLHLVVDLSNFLYRSYNINAQCPRVLGIDKRASKGIKHLTFTYDLTATDLYNMGFNEPTKYNFYESFNLKPIVQKVHLILVNGEV